MDFTVPPGFVPAELGKGFGFDFGPVYLNRPRNLMGSLHGGAMATFADTQLMAIHPGPEAGRTHSPTISLSLDFVSHTQGRRLGRGKGEPRSPHPHDGVHPSLDDGRRTGRRPIIGDLSQQ